MDKPRDDERFGGRPRDNGHGTERPNAAPRPWHRDDERREGRRGDEGFRGDRPNPRDEYAGLGGGFGVGGYRSEWPGENRGPREQRFGREPQPGRDDRHEDRWRQADRHFDDAHFEEHPLRYRDDHPDRSTYEHRFDEPLRYREEPDRMGDGGHRQQYAYSPDGDFAITGHHGVAGASYGARPDRSPDEERPGQYGPRGHGQWREGHEVPRQEHRGRGQDERRGWWQREPLGASEIMTPNVKTVTRDVPVKDVAMIMRNENVGAVPVVDENGRLTGIVTDRDIVVRGLMADRAVGELRTEHVMTDDVEAVHPDDSIHDVIELMGRKQVRRMPVVDENQRLLGIVSLGDVANRADYDEELQDALEKISSKRSFWSRLWR